jgi:hypothetical protein
MVRATGGGLIHPCPPPSAVALVRPSGGGLRAHRRGAVGEARAGDSIACLREFLTQRI